MSFTAPEGYPAVRAIARRHGGVRAAFPGAGGVE
jgi:hypothetical protein